MASWLDEERKKEQKRMEEYMGAHYSASHDSFVNYSQGADHHRKASKLQNKRSDNKDVSSSVWVRRIIICIAIWSLLGWLFRSLNGLNVYSVEEIEAKYAMSTPYDIDMSSYSDDMQDRYWYVLSESDFKTQLEFYDFHVFEPGYLRDECSYYVRGCELIEAKEEEERYVYKTSDGKEFETDFSLNDLKDDLDISSDIKVDMILYVVKMDGHETIYTDFVYLTK